MRILWVEFSKEGEKLVTRALFFGIFCGFMIGTLLFILLILPTIPRKIPQNTLEWANIFSIPIFLLGFFGCFTSILFTYIKYRTQKGSVSEREFVKAIIALLLMFPSMLIYAFFTGLFVLVLFDDFFSQWLSPGTLFPLGMLLVFPFVFLFIAITLPDFKPRKLLTRSLRKLKRVYRKRVTSK